MHTVIVRRALESDLPEITEIYNDAILNSIATFDTETKSLEDRKHWLLSRGERHPVFVAEDSGSIGSILGWASLNQWSDRLAYSTTVENSVYVRAAAQGRGVGKALMEALMNSAKRSGVRSVLARISDGNETSLALHKQFGFEFVGILQDVGYKFDRYIDVHMLQRLIAVSQDEV